MSLPPGFIFTQTVLRTYQRCALQFRRRYLERLPAIVRPLQPEVEAAMERGRRFHQLAQQHLTGLDVAAQVQAEDEPLRAWWSALRRGPPDLAAYPRRYTEAGLSIPLGPYRLAARYDLLALGEAAALVVDWKTGADLASGAELAADLQTRVYLYLLAEGGTAYQASRPLPAQSLAMLYWHPRGPQQALLSYSPAQHQADGALLHSLVEKIAAHRPEEMLPRHDDTGCSGCPYAPLCGRAGGLVAVEEEEGPWFADEEALAEDI